MRKVGDRRPSTGTVLGSIALFVALGGTALAATGQLVHIADGVNGANIAKVSAQGALQVQGTVRAHDGSGPMTVDGKVSNVPVIPEKRFSTYGWAALNRYVDLTPPTMAKIAIDRLVIANDVRYGLPTQVIIYHVTAPVGTTASCASSFQDARLVGVYALQSDGTVVDAPSTPLVFGPNGRRPWCLIGANFARSSTAPEPFAPHVVVSGSVIAGDAPSGTAARSTQGEGDLLYPGEPNG